MAEVLLPSTLGQHQGLGALGEVDGGDIFSHGRSAQLSPLLMVQALLLQQCYNLSDLQMEDALSDRISFRRVVGLGLQDDSPDHSTISRFCAALGAEVRA